MQGAWGKKQKKQQQLGEGTADWLKERHLSGTWVGC